MTKKIEKEPPPNTTPGPKPDLLKIKGNWQDAIKKSFGKKKPPGGWPK
jgi:hypothetical protein